MLPQDPIILLSYVNTQLRDRDASLAAFCDRENADEADLRARLQEVGYIYDAQANRFVRFCSRMYPGVIEKRKLYPL